MHIATIVAITKEGTSLLKVLLFRANNRWYYLLWLARAHCILFIEISSCKVQQRRLYGPLVFPSGQWKIAKKNWKRWRQSGHYIQPYPNLTKIFQTRVITQFWNFIDDIDIWLLDCFFKDKLFCVTWHKYISSV